MHESSRRSLTLADLMILIAANGVGLGCFLFVDDHLYGGDRFLFGLFEPLAALNASTILDRAEGAFAGAVTLFGAWTFALPIIAMRKARPIRRRLFLGPGLTGCMAGGVGLLACAGTTALAFLLRWIEGRLPLPPNFWYGTPILEGMFMLAAVGVAAAWVTQLLTSRWRAAPNAIDRLGRLVGALWASAGLVFATRLFLG